MDRSSVAKVLRIAIGVVGVGNIILLVGFRNSFTATTAIGLFLLVLVLVAALAVTEGRDGIKPLRRKVVLIPIIILMVLVMVSMVRYFAAAKTPSPAEPSDSPQSLHFDEIPGQFPDQPPGIPGAGVAPVGACISLEGRSTSASLKIVDCGSPTNGYKVVQRVATPEQCARDVDQKFYMNLDEGQFTACLDYAWEPNDCLSIGKLTAVRAACDDKSIANREKPVGIILDSTSADDCPSGGFPHPQRRFTICTQTQD